MTPLSKNFSLEDFTASKDHPDLVAANLKAAMGYLTDLATCAARAEDLQDLFGAKVNIHSGFRFKPLNDAVGSQDHSQHMVGQAFDFDVRGNGLRPALKVIVASNIPYHQLLIEGACLHLGIWQPDRPNGEVAWWEFGKKVIYQAAK